MDEKQLVDGATALAEKQSRVIKIEPAGETCAGDFPPIYCRRILE